MSGNGTGTGSDVHITARIPGDLDELLRARAEEEDRSASAIVRLALRAYLDATDLPDDA